jgi:hypothetical protein
VPWIGAHKTVEKGAFYYRLGRKVRHVRIILVRGNFKKDGPCESGLAIRVGGLGSYRPD